jgi:hypothetical protein
MSVVGTLVLSVILALIPTQAQKDQSALAVPDEVSAYGRAIEVTRTKKKSEINVEQLLALGRHAGDALLKPINARGMNALEELSDESFQAVAHQMEGFWVNRQEVLYVEPDPSFFLKLARSSGDQASIEFFEAFTKTFQHGWKIYHEQQTDYSGCIRFGSMSLVNSYAIWDAYRIRHPKRYSGEVQTILKDLEEDLAAGTCVCGEKNEVMKEFQEFIRAFPSSILAKRLQERLDQIRAGKSNMRWHCISG